ncbi:MAG: type III-B CRISPR module-associated protein Cmr5 [Deltaproteobacteria bacterium]|nr:type III-B CRISPR module-associated protein Cmr5 [Deltaproteobacteria bacterium]
MRTLGQKRAEFALQRVTGIPAEAKERFKPFSAGAPTMILQNGFGQALAFWVAKAKGKEKGEHMEMFNIVKEWLSYDNGDVHNRYVIKTDSPADFFSAVSKMTQSQYLTAQKETLALIEWVKRFANADL